VLRERHLSDKIAVVGSWCRPGEAAHRIGAIREGFLWIPPTPDTPWQRSPNWNGTARRSRTAPTCLASAKAIVDPDKRIIAVNRMLDINKQTVDGLIADGL